MRFFKTETTLDVPRPATSRPAAVRPPVVEGWSERELVSVYNAARVRHLKAREAVFPESEGTDSFFVLLSGALQVVVKWDGHAGRPAVFQRGECVAPLPKSPGLSYCAEAAEPATIIEITPAVLKNLPETTQLSVYKVAVTATSRINAYIRAVNGEVNAKNALLAAYVAKQLAGRSGQIESPYVQNFIRSMPAMPTYAVDLAMKLLNEGTSVQEVVEGIKRDPSVAGIVLRTVNSAAYSFHNKIETFYHACMILGFSNIYNLILREAVQSAMPVTPETQQIHKHSCLISVLSWEVASAAKDVNAQTATTIGLLHDIGKGVQTLMKRADSSKAEYIDTLQSARLGAEQLKVWGLPERIWKVVESQQDPEFMAPDTIPSEYRSYNAVLHIAHILESLLNDETSEPETSIYTRDYMAVLGLGNTTPADLLKDRVIPNLMKSRNRLPEQIRDIFNNTPALRKN
jgi:putative nucleotidyltransferase with HDIG domain